MATQTAYPGKQRLVLGLIVLSGAAPLMLQLDAQEEDRLPGLGLIVTVNGRLGKTTTAGAGVIVGRETDRLYIATANHLVREGSSAGTALDVTLEPFREQRLPAKLLPKFDGDLDLAVLAVDGLKARGIDACSLALDALGPAGAVKRGHFVLPVGNAQGVPWAVPVEPDRIVDVSRTQVVFQSATIARGHAGGGLLNANGELVGMIQTDQPPYARAIDIHHVSRIVAGWNLPVHVTPRAPGGAPALAYAAETGEIDAVKRLLGQPCTNVNAKDRRGRTALHLAIAAGEVQIVETLLAAGAGVNAGDRDGATPLQYAARSGSGPMIRSLLARGADINPRGGGAPALCAAAEAASPEAVAVLLERGADANASCGDYEPTPLFIAAGRSYSEKDRNRAADDVVGALARAGANLNIKNGKGETPLGLAVGLKRLAAVRYLIEAGASVNVKSRSGESPLRDLSRFSSSSAEDMQTVREMEGLLLGRAPRLDAEAGRELLEQSAREGWPEIAERAIQNGVDVRGAAGYDALKTAAGNRRTEVLKVLLAAGADPNAGSAPTPLQQALSAGNQARVNAEVRLETVRALVAGGAKVNVSPRQGAAYLNVEEPLYLALVHLEQPDLKVAEILISCGAVATDTLVNATRSSRPEVIALVRKATAARTRTAK